MSYNEIKKVYKIQDNCIGCLSRIRALIEVLEDRNCENYPANYLFSIVKRNEKTAVKKLFKISEILTKYVRRKR